VPKIALYPALVLVFGFGHASKVALVLADAAFPIMLATFHGARAVPPKLLWSAWGAGADRRTTLFTVVLPSAFPSILTGCRIGMTIACVNVFLAEMISSSDGLGHVLIVAARSYRTTDMYTPLVLIAVIGLALTGLLNAVRRRYSRDQ
jgi:NitT/TauT family transport system permease protein